MATKPKSIECWAPVHENGTIAFARTDPELTDPDRKRLMVLIEKNKSDTVRYELWKRAVWVRITVVKPPTKKRKKKGP